MATDSGYSNQKKKGLAQFETVHNLGSAAYGKSVAPKALFQISLASETVVSVSDIIGSDGQVQYWNIEITAHGASVGNIFRIDAGSLLNAEYEIIQVIDVDNFYILPITDVKPVALDTGVIMGWVTTKVGADGSSAVSILSAPTSYNYDGAPQTVEQDTVVPANNRALPNLNFIYKDGVQVPITKDTGLPSNTVGMPVEIVAASGTPINITAGDINVQLSDQGVNFDSLRVGDGSGIYLAINADGSINVADMAEVRTAIEAIDGKLGTLGQKTSAGSAPVVLSTEQETILSDIEAAVEAANNKSYDSLILATNSTTTPLAGGASFTGPFIECYKYSTLSVILQANVAGTLNVEYSVDGVTVIDTDTHAIPASSGKIFTYGTKAQYIRVRYVNGGAAQASFALQAILHAQPIKNSTHTADDIIDRDDDAELVKAVLTGLAPNGNFINVGVTNGGNFKIALEEFEGSAISQKASADSLPVVLSTEQELILSGISGKLPATLGTKAAADSLAATLSTEDKAALDQISSDIQSLILSQTLIPSYSEELSIDDSVAVLISAPVGAKWCKVQADDANNSTLRVKIGGTATVSSGIQFQAGRSEDYNAVDDITVIAQAGGTACKLYVQWGY